MPKHVLAFVKWNEFRRGGKASRPERSFFYALAVPHLHKRVGNGGTLWMITRRPYTKQYSLAYKLVNCRAQNDIPAYIQQAYGSGNKTDVCAAPPKKNKLQLVVSHDWESCEYYPENDVTDVLLRLNFVTGKSIKKCKNIGSKILGLPELRPSCVPLLEAFALNLMKERFVFLSYSRKNKNLSDNLVKELGKRDVVVYRDIERLVPSEPWRQALERIVRGCDLFLVLLTHKASSSKWVPREVTWALEEIEHGGCVSRILPLHVDNEGWKAFPKLHHFHNFKLSKTPSRDKFDALARSISGLSRRRASGWDRNGHKKSPKVNRCS